jgi:putative DNA primase/helicase
MTDNIPSPNFDDHFDRIANGRTPAQEEAAKANGHRRELPELLIIPSNLPATVEELAKHLAANRCLFTNGTWPVRVAIVDGFPTAIAATTDAVRMEAHKICRPVKAGAKDGQPIEVTLSQDVAHLYLYGKESEWGLPILRGTTTAPILEDDGSMRTVEGYDEKSGLWCHRIPELIVPENPTREMAEAALYRIRCYFRTFAFADSERITEDGGVVVTDLDHPPGLDESAFLAALLTAAVRQSLVLAPAILIVAPNLSGSGTGKGLLARAIQIVGSGISPQAFTGGHDKQELEKRLISALMEASPGVLLDNYNVKELTSETLESAITESPIGVRPLGKSEIVRLHTRTLIQITGNGVQIAIDMARRVLKIDLDAKMENPGARKFERPDEAFLNGVFEDRAQILTDALIIWRFGRRAKEGEIVCGRIFGNFSAWSRWCRDPLLTLGCSDPVERIDEIQAVDPVRMTMQNFFEVWWEVHGNAWIRSSDVDERVVELADPRATRKPDGMLSYNRQAVASFLNQQANTRVAGFWLERQQVLGIKHRKVYQYRLSNEDATTLRRTT